MSMPNNIINTAVGDIVKILKDTYKVLKYKVWSRKLTTQIDFHFLKNLKDDNILWRAPKENEW